MDPDSPATSLSNPTKPTTAPSVASPDGDSRFTFDTFVVGETNKLAVSAAKQVAENPGHRFNPLFISGPTGVGKTHLVRAIAQALSASHPTARALYATAAKFMEDLVQAMRTDRLVDFHRLYRDECAALILEDVQLLEDRDQSQDEFFHAFNALRDRNAQVVITADCLPHQLSGIAERLISRFSGGMIATLERPDQDLRLAIVRDKAERLGIVLPEDVALLIAKRIQSSVRALEGALTTVAGKANGAPLTVELVFALIQPLLQEGEVISIGKIQRVVAAYYNIRTADIRGPKRHRAISIPRQVAMYLCRRHTDSSYPEIGRHFGGKDHSTVITAFRKMLRLSQDPGHPVYRVLRDLEKEITG